MDKILMITDGAADLHLLDFACRFSSRNSKRLEIATSHQTQPRKAVRQTAIALNSIPPLTRSSSADIETYGGARFNSFDAARLSEKELAAQINRKGYFMVVVQAGLSQLNLQVLLNHISCPLMLLPNEVTHLEISRIVYLTDLRYCLRPVVSKLTGLNSNSLLLAHLCQQGLPELAPAYGKKLFLDTFGNTSKIYFSQIKETGITKIVDTLTGTMQADLLVCVNRNFHFSQLFGAQLPCKLPGFLKVPVLVFPS